MLTDATRNQIERKTSIKGLPGRNSSSGSDDFIVASKLSTSFVAIFRSVLKCPSSISVQELVTGQYSNTITLFEDRPSSKAINFQKSAKA